MKWLVVANGPENYGRVTYEVDADSREEAWDKGYALCSQRDCPWEIGVEPMEEDKQLICDKLVELLSLTRYLYDVRRLTYDPEKETVTALFENGHSKTANVAMDSGISMIRDIIRQIV